MTNIYILSLNCGKYYIGKSNNVLKRYQQHLEGCGSAWTKKYKPIKLVETITDASPFEEDRITKEYMSKYGRENVRGGSYVGIQLTESQNNSLNRELWGEKNLCIRCGRPGHFVNNCFARTNVDGEPILSGSDSESDCSDDGTCYRCGRHGHWSTECYARRHINGHLI